MSIKDLYKMRDDLKKKLQDNPDDFTSKHLLQSVQDDIRMERKKIHSENLEKLKNDGIYPTFK